MHNSRLVYSSDSGRAPRAKPAGSKQPPTRPHASGPAVPAAPDDGWVRLWRVRASRGGKTATIITGVPASGSDLDALAVELRRLVGAGGTVRLNAIEIQGDHRERLHRRLIELGYRVKLAGG